MFVIKHMLQIMDEYISCIHLNFWVHSELKVVNCVHFLTVFRVKEAS